METRKPDIQAQLQVLRNRFVERVQDELSQLQVMVESVVAREDPLALRNSYQLLHRLAGSAGTFGFSQLGQQARVIEQRMKPLVELRDVGDRPSISEVLTGDTLARVAKLSEFLHEDPRAAGLLLQSPAHVENQGQQSQNTLLLLEPDPVLAELMTSSFEHFGYCVVWHADESRLDELFKPETSWPAVAIIDLQLQNSYCRRIAELPNSPSIPHIVISFEDNFDVRYQAARKGADGFFSRPTDIPALVDRLEQLLGASTESTAGRVLVVDDDIELAGHYAAVLNSGGLTALAVTDAFNLLDRLHEFKPDIVFMDLRMGDISGMTLARMIRFQDEWAGLSIIYLSSEQDANEQLLALSEGADEFITKPVSDSYLIRSARIRCARARQVSMLMSRDSLTGLLKHSLIKLEAEQVYARIRRGQGEAVFAMIDLDHFKRVNDTYGHAMGDLVIKSLANLLLQRLRKTDTLGRYGGEEFAIILHDCDLNKAAPLLEDIRQHFADLPFTAEDQEFFVTLSVGAAAMSAFKTAEAAMHAADEALYQAKSSGRNGVVLTAKEIHDAGDGA
ncbi:MAG: diguanylate cyclase [Marinobacter sp.]|nr:diguanylate cyclase [Marinobacter sp.]